MFDLSLAEILVIIVLAIIIIKPEDMPEIMRTIGKIIGKIKRMTREFTAIFDDVSGDIKKDIKEIQDEAEKAGYELHEITDQDGNIHKAYNIDDLEDMSNKKEK